MISPASWRNATATESRLRVAPQVPTKETKPAVGQAAVTAACAYLLQHHLHWLRILRPRRSPVKWLDSACRLGRCRVAGLEKGVATESAKLCTITSGVCHNSAIFQLLTSIEYGHKRAAKTLLPEAFPDISLVQQFFVARCNSRALLSGKKSRSHLTPALPCLRPYFRMTALRILRRACSHGRDPRKIHQVELHSTELRMLVVVHGKCQVEHIARQQRVLRRPLRHAPG